jgi:hypothetical protein
MIGGGFFCEPRLSGQTLRSWVSRFHLGLPLSLDGHCAVGSDAPEDVLLCGFQNAN